MTLPTHTLRNTFALLALTSGLAAQGLDLGPALSPQSFDPAEASLRIGPVDGLTTDWHQAPASFAVPLGAELTFEFDWDEPHLLDWRGAQPVAMTASTTVAQARLDQLGATQIGVNAYTPDGDFATGWLLDVEVLPRDAFDAELPWPDLFAWDVEADANDPLLGGAGALEPVLLGRGPRMVVAAGAPLGLAMAEVPHALMSLLEWRLDGEVVGLGPLIDLAIDEPGSTLLEVGPPAIAKTVALTAVENQAALLQFGTGSGGGGGGGIGFATLKAAAVNCLGCPSGDHWKMKCGVTIEYIGSPGGFPVVVVKNNGTTPTVFEISASLVPGTASGCTTYQLDDLEALFPWITSPVTVLPGQLTQVYPSDFPDAATCNVKINVVAKGYPVSSGTAPAFLPVICQRAVKIYKHH